MAKNNFVYCPGCNTALGGKKNFCPYCGTKIPEQKKQCSPVAGYFLSCLKGLGYAGFFLGVQFAVALAVDFVLLAVMMAKDGMAAFDEDVLLEKYYELVPHITIATAAITLVCLFFFFLIRRKNFFREIGLLNRTTFGSVATGVTFGLSSYMVINMSITMLYSLFPKLSEYSASEDIAQMMGGSNPILEFISISIVTGIIEEVVFRGLIYTTFKKSSGVLVAVIMSSVIFGAAHMNIEQFFYTAALGALMALVYEKSGSIIPPIILHATFNGSNYFIELLDFKYNTPYIWLTVLCVAVFILTAGFFFFTKKVPVSSIKPKERH